MNIITIGEKSLSIPSHVNELSGPQQVKLAGMDENADPYYLLIILLCHKANFKWKSVGTIWYFFRNLILIPVLDKMTFGKFEWTIHLPYSNDVEDAVRFLTEMFKTDERPLVNEPFKRLFEYFVSPGMGSKDMTFGQFLSAEKPYLTYIHTKDESQLATLAAILYLPDWIKLFPSLKRLFLRDKSITRRAKLFRRLSTAQLKAILHFYTGSRRAMIMLNSEVFSTPPGGSGTTKSFDSRQLRKDHQDWFNHISETPRNNAETHNLSVWEVLASMCSTIRDAQRIEEHARQNQGRK